MDDQMIEFPETEAETPAMGETLGLARIPALEQQRDDLRTERALLDSDADPVEVAALDARIRAVQQQIDQAKLDAALAELTSSTYSVDYAGRTLRITKPIISDITGLVRFVGRLGSNAGQRAGQRVGRIFMATVAGKPISAMPIENILFALAENLEDQDVIELSILVLFGGSNAAKAEGQQWFSTLQPEQIELDPVLQALAYRIALSEDLRRSLKRLPLVQAAFRL